MSTARQDESVSDEFALNDHEALALGLSKLWLMHQDRRVEDNLTKRYLKARVFADYSTAIGSGLAKLDDYVLEAVPQPHRDELRGAIQVNTEDGWDDLVSHHGVLGSVWDCVTGRDRALLLGIELVAFSPWGDPKVLASDMAVRAERLSFLGENLNAEIERGELVEIDNELRSAIKKLRKRPTNWMLVGAIGVGGAAIGVVTGGLAAPAVGGAIGSSLGLSGAAATNAGLALLGGGSLASGGLGMAGGTALVATTAAVGGGAIAAGVAALDSVTIKVPREGDGSKGRSGDLSIPATADEAAVEGAKLLVLVWRVVLGVQSDVAKATMLLKGVRESREATFAMVERLGGGRASDPNADELTQIDMVLKRLAEMLEEATRTTWGRAGQA